MDKNQLARRLMATFLEELREHVQALNRNLLALKRAPEGEDGRADRADNFRQLFRTAHSLKGAARSVGARLIEDACHHLEEILGAERDRDGVPDQPLFSVLLASADAIEEA